MISISSKGILGEEDFSCLRLKKAVFPAGQTDGHQVGKNRYAADSENFWLRDKFRTIAEKEIFATSKSHLI
jgi:hypothetical protein